MKRSIELVTENENGRSSITVTKESILLKVERKEGNNE